MLVRGKAFLSNRDLSVPALPTANIVSFRTSSTWSFPVIKFTIMYTLFIDQASTCLEVEGILSVSRVSIIFHPVSFTLLTTYFAGGYPSDGYYLRPESEDIMTAPLHFVAQAERSELAPRLSPASAYVLQHSGASMVRASWKLDSLTMGAPRAANRYKTCNMYANLCIGRG